MSAPTPEDPRPPVWVGHVLLDTGDFDQTLKFFEFIGMRSVARMDALAVLELRGGTHVVLNNNPDAAPAHAGFDLMVDDLPAQHASLGDAGYAPGPIRKGQIHSTFEVTDAAGVTFKFYDSHVAGPV